MIEDEIKYINRLKKRINILEDVLEGEGMEPSHYYKHAYKTYLDEGPVGLFREV